MNENHFTFSLISWNLIYRWCWCKRTLFCY